MYRQAVVKGHFYPDDVYELTSFLNQQEVKNQ